MKPNTRKNSIKQFLIQIAIVGLLASLPNTLTIAEQREGEMMAVQVLENPGATASVAART